MKIQSPIRLAALGLATLAVATIVAAAAGAVARFSRVSDAAGGMVTHATTQTPHPPSKGEELYLLTCHACHQTGAQGAPRLGNREEWKERIRKGRKTLLKHSLEGFGVMPAKGGHATLTKKEVALALDYMLAKLR